MSDEHFESSREAWDVFRGTQGRERRRALLKEFRSMFPEGHRTSIRDIATSSRQEEFQNKIHSFEQLEYLRNIHLDAFAMLAEYGTDYTPRFWHRHPGIEPKPSACHLNAMTAVYAYKIEGQEESSCVYVEGVAFGPGVPPMLHAWNARNTSTSIASDWTFYPLSHLVRYLGIPLTFREYRTAIRLIHPENPQILLLFTRENFPRVKQYLLEVLHGRKNLSET